jgi:hypothetical protein
LSVAIFQWFLVYLKAFSRAPQLPYHVNFDQPIFCKFTGSHSDSGIEPFCQASGGQCITVNSIKEAESAMEFLASKVKQRGVIVSFEPLPGEDSGGSYIFYPRLFYDLFAYSFLTEAQNSLARKLKPHSALNIFMHVPSFGIWPIPEAYWLKASASKIPPREKAKSVIYFSTVSTSWMVDSRLPVNTILSLGTFFLGGGRHVRQIPARELLANSSVARREQSKHSLPGWYPLTLAVGWLSGRLVVGLYTKQPLYTWSRPSLWIFEAVL